MAQDYLPRRQNDLLTVVLKIAVLLMANPYVFGLTPQQAAAFNAAVQDFKAKMDAISGPGGKLKSAVQAKNLSKLQMLATVRPMLQYIKDNVGVADDDKVTLGLNVNGNVRVRVPAPATAPALEIVAATPLQHTLGYHDTADPKKRGKPVGVAAMELYCQIGDSPTISRENAKFVGLITRQPYVMNFSPADVGKTAHYWGIWANAKGAPGPCSLPISLTKAG